MKTLINKKDFKIKTFGQSMYPLLMNGDVIKIEKISYSKINVDDIISFYNKRKIVSHRVIFKCDQFLITAGDNNRFADKRIKPKDIIGKVTSIKRAENEFPLDNIYFYQSSIYWQEILKIKSLFEAKRINYIFLKGLPLHLFYKKIIPKRFYADCDLLVAEDDCNRAYKILADQGYKKKITNYGILPSILETHRAEETFEKLVGKVVVSFDIHTDIAFLMKTFGDLNPLYPNQLLNELTQRAFEKSRIITFENIQFPILNLPQLILYLTLHIYSHNLKGYNRYELLSFLFKTQKNIDYSEIAEDIKRYKLNSYVYPVFLILKKFYSINLPASFLKQVAPGKSKVFYIKNKVLKQNQPFETEQKWRRGSERFKHTFHLSPNKLNQRLFIFLKPHIVYAILWVLIHRVRSTISSVK